MADAFYVPTNNVRELHLLQIFAHTCQSSIPCSFFIGLFPCFRAMRILSIFWIQDLYHISVPCVLYSSVSMYYVCFSTCRVTVSLQSVASCLRSPQDHPQAQCFTRRTHRTHKLVYSPLVLLTPKGHKVKSAQGRCVW